MKGPPGLGFRIWTAALSLFVAVMLFPNIVRRHGTARSIVITALAVGAIWAMYFVIGRLINGAVERELRRKKPDKDTKSRQDYGRGLDPHNGRPDGNEDGGLRQWPK